MKGTIDELIRLTHDNLEMEHMCGVLCGAETDVKRPDLASGWMRGGPILSFLVPLTGALGQPIVAEGC